MRNPWEIKHYKPHPQNRPYSETLAKVWAHNHQETDAKMIRFEKALSEVQFV